MKRFSLFVVLAALTGYGTMAKAQENIEFAYDAGAEVVSTYLWRGQYNGGLSFQPDLAVGWDSEHTSFRFGTWWSLGASDWKFATNLEKGDDYNPNTYFLPELDIYANLNLWGVTMGFTHYYYFGGSNFFSAGSIDKVKRAGHTSQTEVSLGYDFSTMLNVPLSVTWNTMVSGDDGYLTDIFINEDGEEDGTWKRAYSSYLEIAYTHTWENIGLSLGGALGITPWRGIYTDTGEQDIAVQEGGVNNISLRLEKEWSLKDDLCTISVFAQGMINPYNLNKDNAFIKKSGDDKLYLQRVNGCIGMSVWF